METAPTAITVQIKFAGRTIPVEVPAAASTAELKRLLQPLTNVLPRGQKLDGPITKNSSSSTSVRRPSNVKENQTQRPETVVSKSRSERWKLTGVVALNDCGLKAVPEEVWDCGLSIRILDISNNSIKEIPHKISALKSLNKLLLTANDITDENLCWEGLSCLQKLLNLSLSENRLISLPSILGSLISLRELRVANNSLDSLPKEIGLLKHLEILIASNNRITSLPSSIGDCESLTEVDLSSNLLTELPEAFGSLYKLKVLHIRNNGLTSLPAKLFRKCSQLITLDLHGTEITNDALRQVEGWEEFDERRRQKHQKQLDFRVGSSGVFDEGADDDNRRRDKDVEKYYVAPAPLNIL
ncbi:hypothetical protein U9M48_009353 [Paspalum notatum var. saurae]|uniref:Uncharacterized protein n=1 Tax=Paspalum notatum var. saurae TaxID=547442 RepID=A0AAQ3SRA7_PASNO